MSRKVTIVNYYGSQDDSRCGYCSNSNSSQSHGKKEYSIESSHNLKFTIENRTTHCESFFVVVLLLLWFVYFHTFNRYVGALYDSRRLSGFDWSRYVIDCSFTTARTSKVMKWFCLFLSIGWRRSGQYCYKPNNAITCCPSYTIKYVALALCFAIWFFFLFVASIKNGKFW